MKKLLLLSSFALLGSFAMANIEEPKDYTIEFAPEGICTVWVLNSNGDVVYVETSNQPSASACSNWAAGRYFQFMLGFPPGF